MKLSFLVMLLAGMTACNAPGSNSVSSANLNTNTISINPNSNSGDSRGWPSPTPAPSAPPINTPHATPTATPRVTPTATPVVTPTPEATPAATPAATPVATPVATATPTVTASPSATPVVSTGLSGTVGIVWNGAGACEDDCALAGANAVTAAGLTVRYVNEKTAASTDAEVAAVFADARVWVMPGGYASNEVAAIPAGIKKALITFVSNGGGYVGWCAGAFAATSSIGTIGKPGLGLFPGATKVYSSSAKSNSYGASIEKLTWLNAIHYFYLEGGPYMTNLPGNVEVIGRYDDQVSVAVARTNFGNGRVYLSGVHPEAPKWWWSGTSISDPDGTDEAYATEMIKWAAKLE